MIMTNENDNYWSYDMHEEQTGCCYYGTELCLTDMTISFQSRKLSIQIC